MITHCEDCAKGHCDRWEHVVKIVRWRPFTSNIPVGGWTGCVAPAAAVVTAVPTASDGGRCNCGGVFAPDATGRAVCGCCEAPQRPPVSSTDGLEVGQTLREHLLLMRRRTKDERALTDDDVKVTTHD